MFYHSFINVILRRYYTSFRPSFGRWFGGVVLIGALAYFTAFMETWTISGFPYYSFKRRDLAYTVGSAFYGIYFIVSFPMYFRLDETPGKKFSLFDTVFESLGSCMLILSLLDLWRLFLGGLVGEIPNCMPFM
eukprot:GFYU01021954.1.p1 GENE.GFYU01021954.1~~GFYU01021954.1.p1  ORF type:complete len:133 (-),score=40.83 GFYU01021954.1:66-464(-)